MTIQTRNVNVTISEPDGALLQNAKVVIRLRGLGNSPQGAVAPGDQIKLTNNSGQCVFTLWENNQAYSDTYYEVSSYHPVNNSLIHNRLQFRVLGADADLEDLILTELVNFNPTQDLADQVNANRIVAQAAAESAEGSAASSEASATAAATSAVAASAISLGTILTGLPDVGFSQLQPTNNLLEALDLLNRDTVYFEEFIGDANDPNITEVYLRLKCDIHTSQVFLSGTFRYSGEPFSQGSKTLKLDHAPIYGGTFNPIYFAYIFGKAEGNGKPALLIIENADLGETANINIKFGPTGEYNSVVNPGVYYFNGSYARS